METASKPSETPPSSDTTPNKFISLARAISQSDGVKRAERRKFSREEKDAIANAFTASGVNGTDFGRQVGISRTVIRRWVNQLSRKATTKKAGTMAAKPAKKAPKKATAPPRKEGRHYTDEFKRKAVARLMNETAQKIADDLGLWPSQLRTWRESLKNPNRITRGVYSDEFKRSAVQRVERGEAVLDVSRELGINNSMISQWRKKFSSTPGARRGPYNTKHAQTLNGHAEGGGGGENRQILRAVNAAIGLLRGIKPKVDINDPVHLTALLVLNTLEGKM